MRQIVICQAHPQEQKKVLTYQAMDKMKRVWFLWEMLLRLQSVKAIKMSVFGKLNSIRVPPFDSFSGGRNKTSVSLNLLPTCTIRKYLQRLHPIDRLRVVRISDQSILLVVLVLQVSRLNVYRICLQMAIFTDLIKFLSKNGSINILANSFAPASRQTKPPTAELLQLLKIEEYFPLD